MRLFFSGSIAVALVVGLSGCIVVQAPTPVESPDAPIPTIPAGTSQDCDGIALTLDPAGSPYTLSGDCGDIIIEGDGVVIVSAGNLAGLVVRGDRSQVAAGVLGRLEVVGNENAVKAGDIGGVVITGDSNSVDSDSVFGVNVTGDSNSVSADVRGDVVQDGDDNLIGR